MSLIYVVSIYGATGEGMTASFLVTRAYPKQTDYVVAPYYGDDGYHPGEYSPEKVALNEFRELFGEFFGVGAEIVTKEKFFDTYGKWLPEALKTTVEQPVGNLKWYSQIHLNYS